MLNVQALTSTLSAMSLPQLQQYASLHKNDPYVVTMALSIANQKKQALTAQQGQAGQQPMPTVVDQEISQMAPRPAPMPENVGIGQLPAQNIAKMAGGGIVAFAGDNGSFVQDGYYPEPLTAEELSKRDPWGALKRFAQWAGRNVERDPQTGEVVRKEAGAQPAQAAKPATSPDENSAETNRLLAAAMRSPTPPASPTTTQTSVPRPLAEKPAPAAAKPPPTPPVGLPGLITTPEGMQKALGSMQANIKPQVPEVLSQSIKDIQAAEEAQANKNVADIEAEQKARGPALKEFEARVKEKEGRLSKQEEMQGPLALLQAGFAIMSGTSPFAFANIGAGAQVGLKSYVEGAEKLEAARDKLADSYGKIEEVRRNESRMDAKELRDARNAALKPAIDAKKLAFSALEKDWGLSRQEASKGLEAIMANQRSIYEQGEQTRRTGMQIAAQKEIAAMPPAEARTAMLLGTGKTDTEKLESGMRKMAEISQEKGSAAFAKLYATHLDESNKQGVQPMSPDAYAASLQKFVGAMLPRVTSTLPSDAPVRTQ